MRQPLSSRDWFGKVSAAAVLGFLLALGISGLFRIAAYAGQPFCSTAGQFSMWIISPVWALALSLCFLFRSGLRAWAWLLAANFAVWIAIVLLGGLPL